MRPIFIVYDECEDMVLYNGEDKKEAISSVENHIIDGYGELDNVHVYISEKELELRVNQVVVVEEN